MTGVGKQMGGVARGAFQARWEESLETQGSAPWGPAFGHSLGVLGELPVGLGRCSAYKGQDPGSLDSFITWVMTAEMEPIP